jgi:hypothetical protein
LGSPWRLTSGIPSSGQGGLVLPIKNGTSMICHRAPDRRTYRGSELPDRGTDRAVCAFFCLSARASKSVFKGSAPALFQVKRATHEPEQYAGANHQSARDEEAIWDFDVRPEPMRYQRIALSGGCSERLAISAGRQQGLDHHCRSLSMPCAPAGENPPGGERRRLAPSERP